MAHRQVDFAAVRRQLEAEQSGFFCQICGFEYPESSLRIQSGLRVSTYCDYEPNGGTIERDIQRAEDTRRIAELSKRGAYAGKYPGRSDGLGMESLSCMTAISPDPIALTRGGPAVTVTVTGVNLSASDTFDFGHASTTATVTVDSTSQITLQVTAGVGTPAGDYDLTYNDTVWRKRITVRG